MMIILTTNITVSQYWPYIYRIIQLIHSSTSLTTAQRDDNRNLRATSWSQPHPDFRCDLQSSIHLQDSQLSGSSLIVPITYVHYVGLGNFRQIRTRNTVKYSLHILRTSLEEWCVIDLELCYQSSDWSFFKYTVHAITLGTPTSAASAPSSRQSWGNSLQAGANVGVCKRA